jgi:glutamate racemase
MKYGEGVMGMGIAAKNKIGVFDSGVGGLSVVNRIKKDLPGYDVIYATDKEHIPYGTKTPQQLHGYVLPILKRLADEGCKVIVIACNTVTTTIIGTLRQELDVPLIGLEPMVKPAAKETKTGVIAVCATPTTLASKRYDLLKKTYARGMKIIQPDCSEWTKMIENNQLDIKQIYDRINYALEEGADVIVLGCTHYHWIEETIKKIVNGRAKILQPEVPVIHQLKRVLRQTA